MIQMPENLDFLMDKKWVEDFLNQNSEKIFKQSFVITVTRIERSKSFAPEVFNMIYDITLDGKIHTIRASASTLRERETTYKVMDFLYKNGFASGDFLVPQPLNYFPELNLMFYIDLPGFMMKDFIADNQESFGQKVKGAGEALKQLHGVPMPDFPLSDMNWAINQKKILEYAPDLKNMFGTKFDAIMEKSKTKNSFVHGDYQPKNIILGDKLGIIDFGSATLANKELDVACFVTQLEIMLKRYSDVASFEYLKQKFLDGYGVFNQEYYDVYDYLYRLQILQALTVIYEYDPNADKEEILSAIDYWAKRIEEKYERNS